MTLQKSGLYVHIPFCSGKCPYCDFVSFKADINAQKSYVNALKNEMQSLSENMKGFVFDTVFVGGGTPSALYGGGLKEIFDCARSCFNFDIAEFSVEANPESVTAQFVGECVQIGANRISLGLQSASDNLIKEIRRHNYGDFLNAVELIRRGGIQNINADLMIGLPNQTETDVLDSLNKLVNLNLSHISVYGLKVEEDTPLFKSGYTVDEDKTASFYEIARKLLNQKGYRRYEVSNFSLHGFECRHNQKYWEMQPYLGLGLSASSHYNNLRTTNTDNLAEYANGDFVKTQENVADKADFERIMLSLRTDKGVDLNLLSDKGIKLLNNPKTRQFIDKNALVLKENRLLLSESYYYLMNYILTEII